MSPIHNSRRAFALVLAIGALALLALSFACGGGDDKATSGTTTPAATTPAASASNPPQEFDVTMTDNKFDPAAFTASEGAALTFNLTNNGIALHNLRVAGEDNQFNTTDDAVSDPDLISGGKTGALTWTAPQQAGEYKFQCDIHPTDMKGTITVH